MSTEIFKTVQEHTRAFGEKNDCAVKAVAIATKTDYATVHALFKKLGRKSRQGTYAFITLRALKELGYDVKEIYMPHDARRLAESASTSETADFVRRVISKYPKFYNAKKFTVNQLESFSEAWSHIENALVVVRGHVLAYQDGLVHDWTKGKKNAIESIMILSKR